MDAEQVKSQLTLLNVRYGEQKKLISELEGIIVAERDDRKKTEEDAIHMLGAIKRKHDDHVRELKQNADREIKLLQAMLEEGKDKIEHNTEDIRRELESVKKKLTASQKRVKELEKAKEKVKENFERDQSSQKEKHEVIEFDLEEKKILLSEATKAADQCMAELKDSRQKYNKLVQEMDQLRKTVSKQTVQKGDVQKVSENHHACKKEISELKTKLKNLQQNNNKGDNGCDDNDGDKIELRKVKREVDALNDKMKFMREINIGLRQEKRNFEEEIAELKGAIKAKETEINTFEKVRRESDVNLQKIESDYQNKVKEMQERIDVLEGKCKVTREIEGKVSEWKIKYEVGQKENQRCMDRIKDLEKRKTELVNEMTELKSKEVTKDNLIRKLADSDKKLRTACEEMDVQAARYEELYTTVKGQLSELKLLNTDLSKTNSQLANDIRNLRRELADESKQVADLKNKLDSEKHLTEGKVDSERARIRNMEEELIVERRNARDAMEASESLEHEIRVKAMELDGATEQMVELEEELRRVKEEAAKNLTTARTLQSSKCQLTIAFEEALRKNDNLEARMNSILNEMENREAEEVEKRIKLEEQIAQHNKLNEYMQRQLEALEAKKKPLIGFNYPSPAPSSRSGRSVAAPSAAMSQEIQAAQQLIKDKYEREKKTGRRLQEKLSECEIKLHKAEAELFDLKMENKLIKASVIDMDQQGTDPTAPPPYAVTSDGSLSNSTHSSDTTDNNDLMNDRVEAYSLSDVSYRRATRHEKRVYADVHGHTSSGSQEHPADGEFTFTDSILEDLGDEPAAGARK